jgi:hypothetical protein
MTRNGYLLIGTEDIAGVPSTKMVKHVDGFAKKLRHCLADIKRKWAIAPCGKYEAGRKAVE